MSDWHCTCGAPNGEGCPSHCRERQHRDRIARLEADLAAARERVQFLTDDIHAKHAAYRALVAERDHLRAEPEAARAETERVTMERDQFNRFYVEWMQKAFAARDDLNRLRAERDEAVGLIRELAASGGFGMPIGLWERVEALARTAPAMTGYCDRCGAGLATAGVCQPCWQREYDSIGDGPGHSGWPWPEAPPSQAAIEAARREGYRAAQREALRTVSYHRSRAERWNDVYRPGGLQFADDMERTLRAEIENGGPLTSSPMGSEAEKVRNG